MPFLVGPNTPDTTSINGPCTYPAKPVTGAITSPNVYINKTQVKYLHAAIPPDTVDGVPNNPLIPCVVPVAGRKVVTSVNTSVYINKFLPAVQGDATELTSFPGTKRVFVAPFQYPTVHIATKKK